MAENAGPLVEAFYREKWRDAILVLTRRFGPQHLHEIENAVQTAMAKALASWPRTEIPSNPGGWILTVARNELIDRFRHLALAAEKSAQLDQSLYADDPEPILWSGPLEDDVLKMIMICCHPMLTARESIAITLRLICGLTTAEIAEGLLSNEQAVKKLLTRTKRKIRDGNLPFEIPSTGEIEARRDRVLHVLYLLFNEGYAAHRGEQLIRGELCREAQRLVALLLRCPIERQGPIWALAALMALQASRLPARADDQGRLLRLEEQDRAKWDRSAIAHGFACLERSMADSERSKIHLEAAIAACHAIAPSYQATDWWQIRALYDDLASLAPSPVVELNRSVAVMMTEGHEAGIAILERLEREGHLAANHLLPALLGDFHRRAARDREADAYFARALALARNTPARKFLAEQIHGVTEFA